MRETNIKRKVGDMTNEEEEKECQLQCITVGLEIVFV